MPTATSPPLQTRCRFYASGLPSAAVEAAVLSWPADVVPPVGEGPAASVPVSSALARPGELRDLRLALVPSLVLEGDRSTLACAAPAGMSWRQACLALAARAVDAANPVDARDDAGDLARALSHDLQGPLSGATRLIDMALEGDSVGAPERIALEQAGRAVQAACVRLEALRLYLRIGSCPFQRQWVDASEMVTALLGELGAVWPHPSRRLLVAPAMQVRADREQLHLALRHLLDNALKFSSGVEHPEIWIELHDVEGFSVIAVSDNGAGFSAAHAGQLFGLFQRVHLASEFPGQGAGLALVRRIAERHGGWAWADLGTPERTVFLLALPIGKHSDD